MAAQQLNPALQWIAKAKIELEPSLQWDALLYHKFIPNVVNYPFYFDTPLVKNSSVPMTISGCFVGYSIYMQNTGSAGTTVVEIYADGTLKDTVNISADGGTYNKVQYFDLNQMLNPQDTFEVKVIGVATGADDLKVNMYLMTFPFEMDTLFYSNLLDGVLFTGVNKEYLFETADYWTVDFNQPIMSVTHVTITDENGDPVDATYVLTDGVFFNSRIRITPYTTSVPKKIQLKIQDYNERYHVFDLSPKISPYMGEYPQYVSEAISEFDLYIAGTAYRYSFDAGSTWSDWASVLNDNTVTVDFSGEATGQKNIKMQYQIGSDILEEDFSAHYLTGEIDTSVLWVGDYAEITYSDEIPLDRIEVYYDGVLADTLSIPVLTGFETFVLDTANKELDIAAGSIYFGANKYDYVGSSWSLVDIDFESYNYATQYIAVFGFDTIENKFDVKLVADNNPSNGNFNDRFPEFVRIWTCDFLINTQGPNFTPYTINPSSSPKYVFEEGKVDVTLDSSKDITIRIIDISGRTKDFEQPYEKVKYNIWRYLTISKWNLEGSSYNGAEYPEYVIDNSDSFWTSKLSEPLPAWIIYEFGVEDKQTIVEVSIKSRRTGDVNGTPKDFKIQGSNDKENWDDLHIVTGETWTDDGPKIYSFSNTTAYAFYRLYIIDTQGGNYVQIKEIQLRASIGGADLTSYTETEIYPGEIHQSEELNVEVTSDNWGDSPDGPTE